MISAIAEAHEEGYMLRSLKEEPSQLLKDMTILRNFLCWAFIFMILVGAVDRFQDAFVTSYLSPC